MNKMKKFMTILACFAFILVGCVALTACGGSTTPTMTEADFLKGIEAGSVKLTGNVTISKTVEITEEVTIDLNGFSIKESMDYDEGARNMFLIKTNGNLAVKGEGNVTTDDLYIFTVTGSTTSDASLTVEGGNYQADCTIVYVTKGKADIKGGEYKIVASDPANQEKYAKTYTLNTLDPNTDGTITVYAGKFHGFNPKDPINDAKVDSNSTVDPSESTTTAETVYTVTVNA